MAQEVPRVGTTCKVGGWLLGARGWGGDTELLFSGHRISVLKDEELRWVVMVT